MFRVGLTGGIGSGKTTVANLFSELGVDIIDTDQIAHQLTTVNSPAYSAIVDTFGDDILLDDSSIDRKKLAQIIFSSKIKKKQLENIIHPLIWLVVEQQITLCQSIYCIIVVPLLFEGHHQNRFNRILVVDSTEEQQLKRVKERDKRSNNEIMQIINQQVPRSERLEQADDVLENSLTVSELLTKVEKLHKHYSLLAHKND